MKGRRTTVMNEHASIDMKRLEEIKIELEAISKRYGVYARIHMYDELAKEIEIQDLYHMSGKEIHIKQFEICFVSSDYHLMNSKVNKKVDSKWLMLLENGNIGAFSICRDVDYAWVNEQIYKPMENKLNELSCKYDPLNNYWLFEPSQSTIDEIKNIINEAYEQYELKRKEHERKRLLKQLAELG